MNMDIQEKLQELSELHSRADAERLAHEQKLNEIMAPVMEAITDENAMYQREIEWTHDTIAELQAEIKADVLALGKTVKAANMQAVYTKGRVTWDSKALDGYATGHPELFAFRKEGEPSVSFRFTGGA
jgi:hypothetical protein